jgi:hypothetical protein
LIRQINYSAVTDKHDGAAGGIRQPNPEFIIADLMRSLLSRTAASGIPASMKYFAIPLRYKSTSTSTG